MVLSQKGLPAVATALFCVFILLSSAGPAAGTAIHPTLSRSLSEDRAGREWTVWVLFSDRGLESSQQAAALQSAKHKLSDDVLARRSRVRNVELVDERDLPVCSSYIDAVIELGGILRHRTRWLNGGSFVMSVETLRRVIELPFVKEVIPVARGGVDPAESVSSDPGDMGREAAPKAGRSLDYGPSYWQLDQINVLPLHALGITGDHVLMMMLDTGFRTDHEAFAALDLVAQYDYVYGDSIVQNEAEDEENAQFHGTGTWSAAGGYSPGHVIGPAYGASFVLAKTEDTRSELPVEEDNYVAALEWADTLGVWLTSASLTYLTFDDLTGYTYEDLDGNTAVITRAVDIAAAKGILCVNSVGNYGPDPGTLRVPADADTILSCGAVDSAGVLQNFSSRGPTYDNRIKPELCARGWKAAVARAWSDTDYGDGNGTSFSAPIIAGACALVLEAHPEWDPYAVIQALKASGDNSAFPDNDYGAGIPDVYAAIFSETPIYPLPFSLVSPGDSEEPELPVTLVWESTEDLDSGVPPTYRVVIQDVTASPFDLPMVQEVPADTFLVVHHILIPGVTYNWKVFAVDAESHSRKSRETWTFTMPTGSGVADPVAGSASRLQIWPNPSSGGLKLHLADDGLARDAYHVVIIAPTGRRILSRALTGSSWTWDGVDDRGRAVAAGIYWIRLLSGRDLVAQERWVRLR